MGGLLQVGSCGDVAHAWKRVWPCCNLPCLLLKEGETCTRHINVTSWRDGLTEEVVRLKQYLSWT